MLMRTSTHPHSSGCCGHLGCVNLRVSCLFPSSDYSLDSSRSVLLKTREVCDPCLAHLPNVTMTPAECMASNEHEKDRSDVTKKSQQIRSARDNERGESQH